MNNPYNDIRSRIQEDPKWWDENAVPRYCDFSPQETADIYAQECALVLIRCQSCHHKFLVCMSTNRVDRINEIPTLRDRIVGSYLYYGDPPNINCCPSGPTMSSEEIKIVEFWHKVDMEWERDTTLELEFPDDDG